MNQAELSTRQIEALSLCAAYPESTTSKLAQKMGVSNSTFRSLLSGAYLKLTVNTRQAAVKKAVELELITASQYSNPRMAGDSSTDAPPPEDTRQSSSEKKAKRHKSE